MSDAANKSGRGGQGPAKPKKETGGFWSSLVEGFVGSYAQSTKRRNPADPAERMEPVRQDREETGRELIFRSTAGSAGQPPMERVARERRYVARAVAGRSGAPTRGASIPQSTGAPLPSAVRKQMEPQLGADLSGVRVHTSGESAEASKDFGARAFTVGDDVHFNSGEFQPGTKEGDKLLAHELTHVVQGQKSGVQRKAEEGEDDKGAEVSEPGEPAEQEADAVGDEVADKLHGDDKDGDGKDGKPDGKGKKKGDGAKGDGAEEAEGDEKTTDAGEKQDGDAKGEATDEKAPAIGAKLDGVGRKIYLGKKPGATPAAKHDYKAKKAAGGFTGDFANFDWTGCPSTATPHPAAGHPNTATVPKPSGAYSVTGAQTMGAGVHSKKWRDDVRLRIDAEKLNIAKKSPKMSKGDVEVAAQKWFCALPEVAPFKMGYKDVFLLDNWSGHHILPINWGGTDDAANVQFLKNDEHTPFNTWWDAKKSEVEATLT